MRILSLIDSLELGGAERMAVNISNSLSVEMDFVFLVALRKSGPLISRINPRIQLLVLAKSSVLDILEFYKLRKYTKENDIDIIHAHSTTIIWALFLKLSGCKVKLIWHDHFGGNQVDGGIFRNLIKIFNGSINFVISVNEILYEWSKIHFKKSKVIQLNNYPELENIISRPEFSILLLANFRPQKDHETFIKAIKILDDKFGLKPKFALVGAFVDEKYTSHIKSLIEIFHLSNQCYYFGPSNSPEEYLFKAEIGVLSSKSEGLPVSLLEYGIASLFPICTDVGECRRVVGENGIIIESQNPEKLADAIHEALKDPFIKDKAHQFKQKILTKYGSTHFIQNYFKLLNGK